MSDVTRADVCTIACAEAWRGDGEVMASPFGSVPALGARLAKSTFSPDLVLTDGEAALVHGIPTLSTRPDELIRESSVPYKTIFSIVWSGRRHIMMMASQVDRFGNQNIAAIGDHAKPKAQLVGVRGAPGNSVNHATSYWVPDHNPRSRPGSASWSVSDTRSCRPAWVGWPAQASSPPRRRQEAWGSWPRPP